MRMVWGGKEKRMKYRNVEKKYFAHAVFRMPLDHRYLAADGGAGGGAGADGGNGDGNGGADDGKDKPLTFDEFLKQGGNQAEFDKRLQKAIDTAVTNAREKWKTLTDDKISEAEKLAKMTEAEKQQYLTAKKEKELADRESAITKRELMATAKNTLAEKKLPLELADLLIYSDAKSCNDSIAKMEKTFNAAVEAAVKEKLKGGDPMKKAPGSGDRSDLEKQVMAAMNGGRL